VDTAQNVQEAENRYII